MRLVSHPNVVDLKAFFYSNGDKVKFQLSHRSENSHVADPPLHNVTERRGLSESCARVRSGDRLPCIKALCQAQANDAYAASETLHVSGKSSARLA